MHRSIRCCVPVVLQHHRLVVEPEHANLISWGMHIKLEGKKKYPPGLDRLFNT
jgi:hypothetical protein